MDNNFTTTIEKITGRQVARVFNGHLPPNLKIVTKKRIKKSFWQSKDDIVLIKNSDDFQTSVEKIINRQYARLCNDLSDQNPNHLKLQEIKVRIIWLS